MGQINKISISELNQLIEEHEHVQMIDVRSANEFASGHIPGAINIPLEQVSARLEDLCPQDHIVLVCRSGTRACIAHGEVTGFAREISVLDGGTVSWEKNGLPLVVSQKSKWSLERQVRLVVGLLILISVYFALTLSINWLILTCILGIGLTFAGLTDICGLGLILSKLPWNTQRSAS